eukprot:5167878-Amphidinium_carterae.1
MLQRHVEGRDCSLLTALFGPGNTPAVATRDTIKSRNHASEHQVLAHDDQERHFGDLSLSRFPEVLAINLFEPQVAFRSDHIRFATHNTLTLDAEQANKQHGLQVTSRQQTLHHMFFNLGLEVICLQETKLAEEFALQSDRYSVVATSAIEGRGGLQILLRVHPANSILWANHISWRVLVAGLRCQKRSITFEVAKAHGHGPIMIGIDSNTRLAGLAERFEGVGPRASSTQTLKPERAE